MRALALSAALILGAAAPALAQDAETTQLLQDEAALNTRCRGGSGDDTETWQACGARDCAARRTLSQTVKGRKMLVF